MYSPTYSTGMFLTLQQVANTLVSGTSTTPASSPVLPGYYATPYSISAALSGSTSPALYGVSDPNDMQMVLTENTPTQLRKLFIGGLNHDTDDQELRGYYESFGTVVDSIVIKDPTTRNSRGFGFVTFATIEMADIAMAARPHVITGRTGGKTVDAKRAIARDQMVQLQNGISPPTFLIAEPAAGCKLAINDVDCRHHTIDDLRTYFECYGLVEQVEVIGQPRGHGFVVFEKRQDAEVCLQHGPFHAINNAFIEVRDFSELYGYNVHYAPSSNALSYYRHDRQHHVSRGYPHNNQQHQLPHYAPTPAVQNGHQHHHRHPHHQSLSSVNCSPESTSASELGNCSSHNDTIISSGGGSTSSGASANDVLLSSSSRDAQAFSPMSATSQADGAAAKDSAMAAADTSQNAAKTVESGKSSDDEPAAPKPTIKSDNVGPKQPNGAKAAKKSKKRSK